METLLKALVSITPCSYLLSPNHPESVHMSQHAMLPISRACDQNKLHFPEPLLCLLLWPYMTDHLTKEYKTPDKEEGLKLRIQNSICYVMSFKLILLEKHCRCYLRLKQYILVKIKLSDNVNQHQGTLFEPLGSQLLFDRFYPEICAHRQMFVTVYLSNVSPLPVSSASTGNVTWSWLFLLSF